MYYDPTKWDTICTRFPELTLEEKGFPETEGYLGDFHFFLNLATQETPKNYILFPHATGYKEKLETLKTFISMITEVFLPGLEHVAYVHHDSIIVIWGIIPGTLQKELQETLERNPDAESIEL